MYFQFYFLILVLLCCILFFLVLVQKKSIVSVKLLIFRDPFPYYMLNCSILMIINKPACVWYKTPFLYTVIWYQRYPRVRSSLFLCFSQWVPLSASAQCSSPLCSLFGRHHATFSLAQPRHWNRHPLVSLSVRPLTCLHVLPLSGMWPSFRWDPLAGDILVNLTSFRWPPHPQFSGTTCTPTTPPVTAPSHQ